MSWEDVSEFELPTSMFLDSPGNTHNILSEKLFDMVNYLTKIVQSVADAANEVNSCMERVDFLEHRAQDEVTLYNDQSFVKAKKDLVVAKAVLREAEEKKNMMLTSIDVGVNVLNNLRFGKK